MKSILRFGGSAPKPPGFTAFFAPEWHNSFLLVRAASAAALCLSGRCNRSLGLLPSSALSRPVQVRSVCTKEIRRSIQKMRIDIVTNGNSSYGW